MSGLAPFASRFVPGCVGDVTDSTVRDGQQRVHHLKSGEKEKKKKRRVDMNERDGGTLCQPRGYI